MVIGYRQLNPHQQRFEPCNHQEDQSIADLHQADLLVINCCHPVVQHLKPKPSWNLRYLVMHFIYRNLGCHCDPSSTHYLSVVR